MLRRLQPHEGTSETIDSLPDELVEYILQPHEGTSETGAIRFNGRAWEQLQPHEGTSETSALSTRRPTSTNFNPTRVRLKRRGQSGRGSLAILQPHEGTSET